MNTHLRLMGSHLSSAALLGAAILAAAGPAVAAPLVTTVTQNGTLVNLEPAIATSDAFPLPQPAGPGTQGSLVDESYAYVTRTADWTAVRTNDATGLLTNSTAAGTTLQPFPSYLVGTELLQVAQEHRTVLDYSVDLTFSQPVRAYLFLDNRINGDFNAGAGNNSNPNTNEPILTFKLAWVGADGWTRVNTGFMPNRVSDGSAQNDFIGQDEGGTVATAAARTHTTTTGSGNGLNNFSAIFTKTFPAGLNVGVGKAYGITNVNMYGMAFAPIPEPSAGMLLIVGACGARSLLRRRYR